MPKTQTASPTTAHFHHFSPRWSALWAPHQHEPRPHHHQTRGISLHEGPTRRRHTARGLGVEKTRVIGHVVLLWFAPCMPWYALLVRTWACYSESGQPRPRTEQRVNVRNRRPTCETAGSHAGRVGTQVTVAHSQSMTDHGAATHRPAMQHSQERGKRDHLQQRLSHATKPKSHPASNTICLPSKLAPITHNTNFPTQQSQKVTLLATRFVHPPSWLTPPTTPTFPRQQAEKSPQNQHVLSCNPKTPPAPVPGCRRARLRCPWAAVEPGRTTSRRAERSSRRGRRAGGPPPTGTPSSPAAIVAGCKAQPGAPAATCARSSGHPDPPHARPRTPPRPRT